MGAFSSISRRRLIKSTVALAALGALPVRRGFARASTEPSRSSTAMSPGRKPCGKGRREGLSAEDRNDRHGGADASIDRIRRSSSRLSQGSSTYDLVTSDELWMRQPINNGWAPALEDIKAKNPSLPDMHYENLVPQSLLYTDVGGKHYGLPMTMSTPVFIYRKDLFEEGRHRQGGPRPGRSIWRPPRKLTRPTAPAPCCSAAARTPSPRAISIRACRVHDQAEARTDDGFLNEANEPIFNSKARARGRSNC